MHILVFASSKPPACEQGYLNAATREAFAWLFVAGFLASVALTVCLERRRRLGKECKRLGKEARLLEDKRKRLDKQRQCLDKEEKRLAEKRKRLEEEGRHFEGQDAQSDQGGNSLTGLPDDEPQIPDTLLEDEPVAYRVSQPAAENLKAILQMIIGVITVCVVGWRFLYTPEADAPARLLLEGTGVGLAGAAALELAYTLFTPGPDEALDPLMLALSATMLLKLSESSISLGNAGSFLMLGALLAVLFATRLMLAERADGEPRLWWITRRSHRQKD